MKREERGEKSEEKEKGDKGIEKEKDKYKLW